MVVAELEIMRAQAVARAYSGKTIDNTAKPVRPKTEFTEATRQYFKDTCSFPAGLQAYIDVELFSF